MLELIRKIWKGSQAQNAQAWNDGYYAAMALERDEQRNSCEQHEAAKQYAKERGERLQILAALAPARMGHQAPDQIALEAGWLWECFEALERGTNRPKPDDI